MLEKLNSELAGFVELRREGRVLEIRMVKPKVNAICRQLSRAIERAAVYLKDDDDLQVGILSSGQEKAFSAGLDFNEAGSSDESFDGPAKGGFGGITKLWDLKKPLIAAINAPAIGGGMELALACDLMVMAENAYFELPELQRGLLPDGGGLQRLPRRIPYNVATAMIWTGRRGSVLGSRSPHGASLRASRSRLCHRSEADARRTACPAGLQGGAAQRRRDGGPQGDGDPRRQRTGIRHLCPHARIGRHAGRTEGLPGASGSAMDGPVGATNSTV
jgi:crotonobetainyl-CoA hydratase